MAACYVHMHVHHIKENCQIHGKSSSSLAMPCWGEGGNVHTCTCSSMLYMYMYLRIELSTS